jgi:hypothetical protein
MCERGQWTAHGAKPKVKASGMPASTPLTHANMCCRAKGGPKRRIWRKIPILARRGCALQCPERGIDEETLEVRKVEVTSSSIDDAPVLAELVNQIPPDQNIGSVAAPSHACKHALTGNGWSV